LFAADEGFAFAGDDGFGDVDVEDVAAYLEKAKALGAKTLVPPVEIPTGTFAWMQDPEGNTVGLWKTKS